MNALLITPEITRPKYVFSLRTKTKLTANNTLAKVVTIENIKCFLGCFFITNSD